MENNNHHASKQKFLFLNQKLKELITMYKLGFLMSKSNMHVRQLETPFLIIKKYCLNKREKYQ